MEVLEPDATKPVKHLKFTTVIIQIVIFDAIFSLDSVLTAIGLTQRFWVMAAAITVAIIWMLWLSESLSRFIKEHPSVKMLALSFLMMIGVILVADGFDSPIPRGYLYFGMAYTMFVEFLNLARAKRKRQREQ